VSAAPSNVGIAHRSRRTGDLHTIAIAINLFENDTGAPPGYAAGWWAQINNTCAGWHPVYTQLQPTYIAILPDDPLSPGVRTQCVAADGYWYYYGRGFTYTNGVITNSDPSTWILCTKLETSSVTIPNSWNYPWTLNYCMNGT
jgi:hypothetical protein